MGHSPTAETRAKLAEAQKGKHLSEETKAKISAALKGKMPKYPVSFQGRHHTEETKARISMLNKGRPSPRKGKHASDETRLKLSLSHKKKKARRRWSSDEEKILIELFPKESQETILKYLTGRSWDAIKNRAKTLRVHRESTTRFKKGQIPWIKGRVGEFQGRQHTTEAKLKISMSRRGANNPMFGRHHTEEEKAHLRGTSSASWQNPIVREQRLKGILQTLQRRPTEPEARVIKIITEYNLPYKYTGDGTLIVAGLNPDFANCNGAKKLLEIFGFAFHDPHRTFISRLSLTRQEPYRKAIYASLGFDCLVLWDDEMEKLSDEEIAEIIKKFTKSRHKPTAQLKLEVKNA